VQKTLSVALAAVMMAGTLGTAGMASAQSYGRGHDRYDRSDRHDRDDRRGGYDRDDRYGRYDRDDRRGGYDRYDRQDRRERAEARRYERWQRAQRRYNAGRYYAPRGYQARAWGYGQRMPYQYRTNRYIVSDYNRYGLYAPPHGYQYVRSGDDVVLAAVTTGLVVAVIAGLFQ